MNPKSSASPSVGGPPHLGAHVLESRRNPGKYVQDQMLYITRGAIPDSKDYYANRYDAVIRHGKIDLRENDARARHMNFGQWFEISRQGGPWDYTSAPIMQKGVWLGFYTQDLLVRFRRFHVGRSAVALGLVSEVEIEDEWLKYLGLDWNDEAVRNDITDGRGSYYWRSDPMPWR